MHIGWRSAIETWMVQFASGTHARARASSRERSLSVAASKAARKRSPREGHANALRYLRPYYNLRSFLRLIACPYCRATRGVTRFQLYGSPLVFPLFFLFFSSSLLRSYAVKSKVENSRRSLRGFFSLFPSRLGLHVLENSNAISFCNTIEMQCILSKLQSRNYFTIDHDQFSLRSINLYRIKRWEKFDKTYEKIRRNFTRSTGVTAKPFDSQTQFCDRAKENRSDRRAVREDLSLDFTEITDSIVRKQTSAGWCLGKFQSELKVRTKLIARSPTSPTVSSVSCTVGLLVIRGLRRFFLYHFIRNEEVLHAPIVPRVPYNGQSEQP